MIKCFYGIIIGAIFAFGILNTDVSYTPRKLQSTSSKKSSIFRPLGFHGTWKRTNTSTTDILTKESGKIHLKVFEDDVFSSTAYSLLIYDGDKADKIMIINIMDCNVTKDIITSTGDLTLIKNKETIQTCQGASRYEKNNTITGWLNTNCGIDIEIEVNNLTEEDLQQPVVSYSFLISCISVALIFAFSKHAQDCFNSDSTARKTSIEFLILQSVIDLFLSIWHLYLSTLYYRGFDYLILASFMNFAVYLVVHERVIMNIWKVQNPQLVQEGIMALRRNYNIFEGYTLIILTCFIPIVMIFQQYIFIFLILSHSFLPQIYLTARKGYKSTIKPSVIIVISLSRLLLVLYLFGYPNNFIGISANYGYCCIFILYLMFQTGVIIFQNYYPRFFLPKVCRPKVYSYFRDLALPAEEGSECIICMTLLNSPGNKNTDIVNFEKTMHAPCRHMFHEDCLKNWMLIKMECPTCRSSLPLMEE
jgi:Ring finger domain